MKSPKDASERIPIVKQDMTVVRRDHVIHRSTPHCLSYWQRLQQNASRKASPELIPTKRSPDVFSEVRGERGDNSVRMYSLQHVVRLDFGCSSCDGAAGATAQQA